MLREDNEAEMRNGYRLTQQMMNNLQQTQDCRDKAEADLADLRKKFNQRRLETGELRHQLNVVEEKLTQFLMRAEDERADLDDLADLDKSHSDLQSELAKVSTGLLLLLFYIKLPNLI
jgi:predicted  nucleic acid-binding Zn-ribbon protein